MPQLVFYRGQWPTLTEKLAVLHTANQSSPKFFSWSKKKYKYKIKDIKNVLLLLLYMDISQFLLKVKITCWTFPIKL